MEKGAAFAKISSGLAILAIMGGAGFFAYERIGKNSAVEYEVARENSGTAVSADDGTGPSGGSGALAGSGEEDGTVVESGSLQADASDAVAYVNRTTGEAFVKRGGVSAPPSAGDGIRVGDTLVTGSDSTAEIIFADSSVVRLWSNSSLSVKSSDSEETRLTLKSGEIWARVLKPFTQKSFFKIETSDLAAGIRGTSLRMGVTPEGTELVVVDTTGAGGDDKGGVDIEYADGEGGKKTAWMGNEWSYSPSDSERLKKMEIGRIMEHEFCRQNTLADLVYLNRLAKMAEEPASGGGESGSDAGISAASDGGPINPKIMRRVNFGRLARTVRERVAREISETVPKREEYASFFQDSGMRNQLAMRMDRRKANGGVGTASEASESVTASSPEKAEEAESAVSGDSAGEFADRSPERSSEGSNNAPASPPPAASSPAVSPASELDGDADVAGSDPMGEVMLFAQRQTELDAINREIVFLRRMVRESRATDPEKVSELRKKISALVEKRRALRAEWGIGEEAAGSEGTESGSEAVAPSPVPIGTRLTPIDTPRRRNVRPSAGSGSGSSGTASGTSETASASDTGSESVENRKKRAIQRIRDRIRTKADARAEAKPETW